MSSVVAMAAGVDVQLNCLVGDRWVGIALGEGVTYSDLRQRCCAEVDGNAQMCAVRLDVRI